MKLITLAISVGLFLTTLLASETPKSINYELRGAWVATVYNIDWPSSSGLSSSQQQREIISMLNKLYDLKMNAVFFQVRAECDALYRSSYEPWASSLTGQSGRSPGYDPLAFLIKEAHKRGIEVHAWFNPFRVQANASNLPKLSSKHVAKRSPHLIKRFNSYLWLDPSKKSSQDRAISTVLDVLHKYDVDGIHLDDYFYPYPKILKGGKVERQFPDHREYQQYQNKGGRLSRYAWRRAHINNFIKNLHQAVVKTKSWVRFGVSPFGIWKPNEPKGIDASIIAYDHLAADSRKWFKEGWVDYLSPQLYWNKKQPKQDFKKLYRWWISQKKAPLWPGIASARINDGTASSRSASEIVEQIKYTRSKNRVAPGHIHWSVTPLLKNKGGIASQLKPLYADAALLPPIDRGRGSKTTRVDLNAKFSSGVTKLSWKANSRYSRKFLIQIKVGRQWIPLRVLGSQARHYEFQGKVKAVSISAINQYGYSGKPSSVKF